MQSAMAALQFYDLIINICFCHACHPLASPKQLPSLFLNSPWWIDSLSINHEMQQKKQTMICHHLVVVTTPKKIYKKSCRNSNRSNCTNIRRVAIVIVIEASLWHANHVLDHMARLYFTSFWKWTTRTLLPSLLHSSSMEV